MDFRIIVFFFRYIHVLGVFPMFQIYSCTYFLNMKHEMDPKCLENIQDIDIPKKEYNHFYKYLSTDTRNKKLD